MIKKATIILDIEKLLVGKHGVEGFIWPLPRDDIYAVRDVILPRLSHIIREGPFPEGDRELTGIVFNYFMNDIISVYCSYSLCNRFSQPYNHIVPSQKSTFVAGVLKQKPPESLLLRSILSEPPRDDHWNWTMKKLRTLRRLIRFFQWNGFSTEGFKHFDLNKHTAVVTISPLILSHAKWSAAIARYFPLNRYYAECHPPQNSNYLKSLNHSLIEEMLDVIDSGFKAGKERLPGFLARFFEDWLNQATGHVRHYRNCLMKLSNGMPHRLWVGTSGQYWVRLLCSAVREVGGEITGHDHGNGTGFLKNPYREFVEFQSCHTFVTYTEQMAIDYLRGIEMNLLLNSELPVIVSLAQQVRKVTSERKAWYNTPIKKQNPLETLMYVTTVYCGERGYLSPLLPDIVAVDWQARLMSELCHLGYRVLHKPHPEGTARPPSAFVNQIGVQQINKPFEQVMYLADAFIFDYPRSTTFSIAIASRKPIVFIDFRISEYNNEAKKMLEKRCRFVKGWFDENNRAQVDWDELKEAIKESRDLMDISFFNTYLNYGQ